ncbi:MAG TPA: anaerobic glycerol-3-phosphate dehydrogenase subunit GlpB [Candidatus Limnocylindrales bacterium]|nr:anaerobic glycerol-3-phosphate dehydrogenase subunit GlpB [Candidatus Limnocylindrales bacterium]
MPSADVVVVGAGLAGLTAAIGLAEAGARVEVVARGHAATHWTAGGLDLAGLPGTATPEEGIARLAGISGHPYATLGGEVAAALERLREILATRGLAYAGDVASPMRSVPTAIGGTRPASILPSAQSAALAPWSADERLVICGFAGFKDFWPDHAAASLTRAAVWGERGGVDGGRPSRVESLTVELPGLAGRRNLSALDVARLFDYPPTRRRAVDAIASALGGIGSRPGRVALPAALGLADHTAAFEELTAAINLVPFEIPLPPPSIPGLRLFAALRDALRASGGRIVIGEPIVDVAREGRRVTAVSASAAARQRTIRTGGAVLATGGIAGGGLIGTVDGRLLEPVFGLPSEAPPADRWLAHTPFDPVGHPLEAAGIRTDDRLQPVDADGKVVLENVAVVGSMLAGMHYLEERCGDGVAIASGFRAAKVLAGSTSLPEPAAAATAR